MADTAQRFMKKFRPKLIFTCEATVDVLKKAAKLEKFEVKFVIFGIHSGIQSLNDILNSQTNEEVSNFEVVNEKKSEDVAAIMMSSGTSGFPKGVMLKSKTLLAVRRRRTDSQSIIHNVLWYSTLNTTSCMAFMLRTLLHRHTRIIPDSNFDVESFFQNVEKYKVIYNCLFDDSCFVKKKNTHTHFVVISKFFFKIIYAGKYCGHPIVPRDTRDEI